MGIGLSFWVDVNSRGIELLVVDQFIETVKEESISRRIGNQVGLNIVINASVRNLYREQSYLNVLCSRYGKLTNITETICQPREDDYQRIKQIIESTKNPLKCQPTFPPKNALQQIRRKKTDLIDIPYMSWRIGPYEEGIQTFRLLLNYPSVSLYSYSYREGNRRIFWEGINPTTEKFHTEYLGPDTEERKGDQFRHYFNSKIRGHFIFPNMHRITVIKPPYSSFKSIDPEPDTIYTDSEKNQRCFTYTEIDKSLCISKDVILNLTI